MPQKKMQPVKYRDVEDLLASLHEKELETVNLLRQLILECIPGCREKLSYNVPFYYGNQRICFIWPGSVPWGKVQPYFVRLGFTKGYLLSDVYSYLEKGERKEVYCKDFNLPEEINIPIVKDLLFEAAELDKEFTK
ncbi:MAG: DUF1801 domain-containing protein [Bacteroidetes bacterium]|nr:MAG: DUF1801 domain-containing protein [Bacteroidota bacterium]REK05723.1 MAG: DUF1801 domain-containing protein [Bacteroidota bacterium]REK50036.1 MAG: DUF1801 domain-containing protein [Bacteroidota bacterium]